MIIIILIQTLFAWKHQQLGDKQNDCQVFTSASQLECTNQLISIHPFQGYQLICFNNTQLQSQSILYINPNITTQYFIAIEKLNIYVYQLPYDCSNTKPKIIDFTLHIYDFGITYSDSLIYLYGGFNSTGERQNQLYTIDINSLIYGGFLYFKLKSQYIQQLTTNLTLWDDTQEEFTFTSQFPSIRTMETLNFSMNITVNEDLSCTSSRTPGCLIRPSLHYLANYSCIYLFYGNTTININNQIWIYYLQHNLWESLQYSDQFIMMINNPVSASLREMDDFKIGFYGDSKYFIFDIEYNNWFQTDQILDFSKSANGLIAYSRNIFIYNSTNLIYSDDSNTNILKQIYGLTKCQPGYSGQDCSVSHLNCFGICFTDLTQSDICIDCSGHGTCISDICQCDEGYTGDDCGIQSKCDNNCSSVGTCEIYYPNSQCRCPQDEKRGGEDCNTIFCLNDCSGNGDCKGGKCTCTFGFAGDDCSILTLVFIEDG